MWWWWWGGGGEPRDDALPRGTLARRGASALRLRYTWNAIISLRKFQRWSDRATAQLTRVRRLVIAAVVRRDECISRNWSIRGGAKPALLSRWNPGKRANRRIEKFLSNEKYTIYRPYANGAYISRGIYASEMYRVCDIWISIKIRQTVSVSYAVVNSIFVNRIAIIISRPNAEWDLQLLVPHWDSSNSRDADGDLVWSCFFRKIMKCASRATNVGSAAQSA